MIERPSRGDDGSVADGPEIDVLLVDDDGAWLRSMADVLERQRAAFAVRTADDLASASDAIETVDPDCVVCDYDLGAGTGLDLLTELRERGDDRPFILITGRGNESVASDAIGRQVTDYIPKRSLGGRSGLLAQRIETAVDSHRTRRALDRERRSKEAMLDILTAASSREGLASEFCEHLVREREYACAWIGTVGQSREVVPLSAAGREGYVDAAVDPGTAVDAGDASEPALAALASREPRVVAPIDADDAGGGWRAVAAEHGFRSAAAVPVAHEGTTFGVLAVYGTDGAVGPAETRLLREYGETIGYALRSTHWRESLLSGMPVAVEIEVTGENAPLVAVDRRLPEGTSTAVLTTVPRTETLLYVVRVEGATAAGVRDAARGSDPVESVDLLRTDGPIRGEIAVRPPTPETVLADHGGRVVDATVADGRATVTAVSPDEGDVGSLIDALRAVYPDAGVQSVRSADAAERRTDAGDPFESLTDKQRRALELAFYSGYFERPRENNATEVAEKFGVSRQTFTQHLRAGERKLLAQLLSD